jgi:hypothetical protein
MLMKTSFLLRPSLLSAAAVAGAALMPLTASARGHRTTIIGPRGTYQRQVGQTPGHYTSSRTVTNASGQTATRRFDTQKTDTGRTTTAQATGFNGQSASYTSTRTRTDNGYTRQVNATGPAGGTATKQISVSRQDGTVTRTTSTSVTPPKS